MMELVMQLMAVVLGKGERYRVATWANCQRHCKVSDAVL